MRGMKKSVFARGVPPRAPRLKALPTRLTLFTALLALSATAEEQVPVVRLETSVGTIDIELFPEKSPQTVDNFLRLVDEDFYDGLIFHRVIANFMVQAGGYDGALVYRRPPRTVVNESLNGLSNSRGTVAMARTDAPNSADAQFFINVKDNAYLDAQTGTPGYTVFGKVIEGMDAVTDMELRDTHRRGGMADVPVENVVIQSAVRLR